jgi:predicted NBD/HSP70 family sugar kinase
MAKTIPAQTEMVREANRSALYQALLAGGTRTRTELAQQTGLSVPTVAAIVQEFCELGLVAEVGYEPSGGGRPAQLWQFQPDARWVLSLDLSGEVCQAGLTDLLGREHAQFTGPSLRPYHEEVLTGWLAALLKRLEQGGKRIGRVSAAVPGVIDRASGRVHLAPALGWSDYALAEVLALACGREVVLENDVNALALAELHYGAALGYEHVLCVAIGSGVGAGLILEGRLFRGAHSAAGEVGYSLFDSALECEVLSFNAPGPLEGRLLALKGSFVKDGRLVLDTPEAKSAFEAFVARLGIVVHNAVCLVDPQLVVVAWPCDLDGHVAARLQERWCGPHAIRVAPSRLGDEGVRRGVARLALEQLERELCAWREGRKVAT